MSLAASFAGSGALSASVGISLARNAIANVIEASISNAKTTFAATSGAIFLSAMETASIDALSAAASLSVAVAGDAAVALSGAGALASNTILTHTNAFIDTSNVTSAGALTLQATDNASIRAIIAAASAAVGGGGVGVAGSIGLALARNLIGYDVDKTATSTYNSSQTVSGLAKGTKVKVVSGPRSGDIYEYTGDAIAVGTSVDLSKQDYGEPARRGSSSASRMPPSRFRRTSSTRGSARPAR